MTPWADLRAFAICERTKPDYANFQDIVMMACLTTRHVFGRR